MVDGQAAPCMALVHGWCIVWFMGGTWVAHGLVPGLGCSFDLGIVTLPDSHVNVVGAGFWTSAL